MKACIPLGPLLPLGEKIEYAWFCEECKHVSISREEDWPPVCINCCTKAIFGQCDFPIMPDPDWAGRVVRAVWADFCSREMSNPPPKWVSGFDELSPMMQEVDREIGTYLVLAALNAVEVSGLGSLARAALMFKFASEETAPKHIAAMRKDFASDVLRVALNMRVDAEVRERALQYFAETTKSSEEGGEDAS